MLCLDRLDKMTNQNRAREIAEGLVGLTRIEKRVAANRLAKFFDGKMPLWSRQFEKVGPVSVAYLLVAYVWGTAAGLFALAGCPVVFLPHKSDALITIEISLFSLSLLLLLVGRVRQLQSRRAGKVFGAANQL
jgi:hypothetical protein